MSYQVNSPRKHRLCVEFSQLREGYNQHLLAELERFRVEETEVSDRPVPPNVHSFLSCIYMCVRLPISSLQF